MSLFRPATRQKVKLRMAIDGVSGSGKTFSALRFAFALGRKVAVINTESGAVEKYLGLAPDGTPFQFDVCELSDFAPTKYTEAILAAGSAGYEVVVIDSLSHAWSGSGGALELKDRKGGNSYIAWKDITPMHNAMIEAILRSPCHVIATMRSKTEYILETDDRGRTIPRKMGMAPIQRQGMEYEFDLYCSIDSEHIMRVSKSRCPDVADALTVKPGASFLDPVIRWLNDGSDADPSKFAVSEADLQKLAKAEGSLIPPPPKKTAKELMQEAARKVQEQQEQPAQPENEPSLVEKCSGEQVGRIFGLQNSLSLYAEQMNKILAKRGAKTVTDLTPAQADEIIARLSEKLAAKVASGGQPGEGVTGVRDSDPCPAELVAQIKNELVQWEQTEPGVTEKFCGQLKGAGFNLIADMNTGQARELLGQLQIRNMSNFFDSALATAGAG